MRTYLIVGLAFTGFFATIIITSLMTGSISSLWVSLFFISIFVTLVSIGLFQSDHGKH